MQDELQADVLTDFSVQEEERGEGARYRHNMERGEREREDIPPPPIGEKA